jgi:hypothetical protein
VKCSELQELLEDRSHSCLDEQLATRVRLHVQRCPKCADTLKMMEREERLYEDYRQAMESCLEVTPELWQRIQNALAISPAPAATALDRHGNERQQRAAWWRPALLRSSWVAQAAFAFLLVVATVAATLAVVHFYRAKETPTARQIPESGQPMLPVTADRRLEPADGSPPGNLESALQAIKRAEQDYIQAIRILSTLAEKQKATLEPELARDVERNLKKIDESIETTRKAYYEHPTDPELAQYMLAAYARKVELLEELVL